jgi:hypothetical protein
MQDRIFGALTSLLMQMKLVGMKPLLYSAQTCAARQMEVMELAQVSDSTRRFAREHRTI